MTKEVFMTKLFLKKLPNSQENTSVGVSLFVFSCEFGEIAKSTFLTEHLRVRNYKYLCLLYKLHKPFHICI